MLCHGIAPTGFLLSKLVPIPKNKRGNKCDSNNYRQIAISSLLCKVRVWAQMFYNLDLRKAHQL